MEIGLDKHYKYSKRVDSIFINNGYSELTLKTFTLAITSEDSWSKKLIYR